MPKGALRPLKAHCPAALPSPAWGPALKAALPGLGLGLAVTGPWLGGGRALMLDWAPGPRTPVVGPLTVAVTRPSSRARLRRGQKTSLGLGAEAMCQVMAVCVQRILKPPSTKPRRRNLKVAYCLADKGVTDRCL